MRIEPKVPGVHDRADRGLDGEADAVGDRVGDSDRLDPERAHLEPVARPHGHQPRLRAEPVLAQSLGGERQRQRRPVDGDLRLPEQVGQGAHVVLVAVGEQDREEALALGERVGEVGDDVVDPRHLVVGEHEAAVDRDDLVGVLDEHHVEADLAEPAERNQADRRPGATRGRLVARLHELLY